MYECNQKMIAGMFEGMIMSYIEVKYLAYFSICLLWNMDDLFSCYYPTSCCTGHFVTLAVASLITVYSVVK
jgi:hypothetical protein